jgi:hypothetical protein
MRVAEENGGCDGGIVTGAHDVAATHCNWITGGPDAVGDSVDVGAVGECEHPITKSNTSPQSVRVTRTSPRGGDRDTRLNYSDVVPAGLAWIRPGMSKKAARWQMLPAGRCNFPQRAVLWGVCNEGLTTRSKAGSPRLPDRTGSRPVCRWPACRAHSRRTEIRNSRHLASYCW